MALMTLDVDEPADFVVSTGESHAVRDWCEVAFERVGLDWTNYVELDASLMRPDEPDELIGDSTKAAELLGWRPSLSFAELVHVMVEAELERSRPDPRSAQR